MCGGAGGTRRRGSRPPRGGEPQSREPGVGQRDQRLELAFHGEVRRRKSTRSTVRPVASDMRSPYFTPSVMGHPEMSRGRRLEAFDLLDRVREHGAEEVHRVVHRPGRHGQADGPALDVTAPNRTERARGERRQDVVAEPALDGHARLRTPRLSSGPDREVVLDRGASGARVDVRTDPWPVSTRRGDAVPQRVGHDLRCLHARWPEDRSADVREAARPLVGGRGHRGQAGLRHIAVSVGPPWGVMEPVTTNPCRSYRRRFCSDVASR